MRSRIEAPGATGRVVNTSDRPDGEHSLGLKVTRTEVKVTLVRASGTG